MASHWWLKLGCQLLAGTLAGCAVTGRPAAFQAFSPPLRIDSSRIPRLLSVQYTRAAEPKSVESTPV